jgi:ribose-phosphate pyrophosphokinase
MKSIELSDKQKSRVYLASGESHTGLAQATADQMGIELGDDVRKTFASGEKYFRYGKSIRGMHLLAMQSLVQTSHGSVNDSLMELMVMIDAARRGSAAEITVVMPYMAYGRQDRKAQGREPISAATVINMLQSAGANRLVSVDMHSPQTQAVFDGPFDHLTAEGLIRKSLRKRTEQNPEEFVIVSPDGGRQKVAEHYAAQLNLDVAHIPKSRSRKDSSVISRPHDIEGVHGRTAILIDDMIDTAGTLVSAADTLQNSGANGVIAMATHGLFSDPALERLKNSAITEMAVVDTIPLYNAQEALGDRLTVISSAPMLASALAAIATNGSVSKLFHGENYS